MIKHKIANGHVKKYQDNLISKINFDKPLTEKENALLENATYEMLHNTIPTPGEW
jgi:hypothetical protein